MRSFIVEPRRFGLRLIFFLVTVVSLIYFLRFLATPSTGLIDNYPETVYHQQKIIFSPRALFSPAVKAGLIPGRDELISVNGEEIRQTRDLVTAASSIRSYRPFPVQVIRDGTRRLTFEIRPEYTITRIDWICLIILAGMLGFIAYLLLNNYSGQTAYRYLGLAALLYLFVVCVKPFFYENVFSILLIQIGSFTPWLLVFSAFYLPAPRGKKWLRHGLIIAISLSYLVYSSFRLYFIGRWVVEEAEIWLNRFRSLGRINNIANGLAYCLFIIMQVYAYYKSESMALKNQFRWTVTGFVIAISAYYTIEELPLILGEVPGARFGSGNLSLLFLVPIPVFLLLGLRGNKKLPYRTVWTGLLLHALLLVFIFYFFVVLHGPLTNYFRGNNGLPPDLAAFTSQVVLFLALFPLFFLGDKVIKRIFYPRKYKLSPAYLDDLEEENAHLRLRQEQLQRQFTARQQELKMRDYHFFTRGSGRLIIQSTTRLKKVIAGLEALPQLQAAESWAGELKSEYLRLLDLGRRLTEMFPGKSGKRQKSELKRLVSRAAGLVKTDYPDVEWQIELKEEWTLECCPAEVISALVHVFNNACEASSGPRRFVQVYTERGETEYRLCIEDNGSGIYPPVASQVFHPFFTTQREQLGMGLFLARLYLEKNNAHLVFHNKPGAGCVFIVGFQFSPENH